jgi:DNA polymerase-3 subunit beta
MKLKCNRDSLLAAFTVVSNIVPARTPKPVLQNVKLDASSDSVSLLATDLDVAIRMEVPEIEVEVPGTTLLPASRFGLILRESVDAQLCLDVEGQGTVIRGNRSEFRLAGGNPDEFPVIEGFHEERYHEVPARLFKELIRRTAFATDTENSRYALGGVLLEFEDQRIVAVGTDGRRLAKMEGPAISVGNHHSSDYTTIVPTRAMQLIDRALFDSDAEIRVCARGNDILIRSPRGLIFSRLVEGRFPRWRDVLPQRTNPIRIELPAGAVYSALRQASIVVSEDSRGIDFCFGDGSLVLAASTADVGRSRIEMPISYTGQPITIALDNRYIADFLRVLDAEKMVTCEIESAESAALFSTDDGYQYVIMPMSKEH